MGYGGGYAPGSVFPARAGMSQVTTASGQVRPRVPRASGDEPNRGGMTGIAAECSPRERG